MFNFLKKASRSIYLDYAAATPVRREAVKAMRRAARLFGNPSSIHQDGVAAKTMLSSCRKKIAECLLARSDEIIFTGSATESENLAIRGAVMGFRKRHPGVMPHIVMSEIEHSAGANVCKALQEEGLAEVTYVGVDNNGHVDQKALKESLKETTVIVSIIHASSEIGTVQDISSIARAIRSYKKRIKGDAKSIYPLLHTDASQSVAYIDIRMPSFPVDLMTCNSSKLYGPKGAALLFVRKHTPIEPIIFGGGQEYGLRPGTEDLSSIAGFATAFSLAVLERGSESARLATLQSFLIEGLRSRFGDRIRINGDTNHRVPANVNFTVKGFESELLVVELDSKGIRVSSKSACNEGGDEESLIMKALYPDEDARIGGVRVSLGKYTKQRDVEAFLDTLGSILKKYERFPRQTV